MRRFRILVGFWLSWAIALPLHAAVPEIPSALSLCAELPQPARWLVFGEPDKGRQPPLISSHRGALTLAPENTLAAYRYALAYEVALIEVDVRQTADRRFVAFHDSDVAGKSDGEGTIESMSFEQARALNVAAYEPWIGGAYDPSQMASLEEVLELALESGHGIEFDMKFMLDSQPTADLPGFASIVNQYPDVLRRSIINLPPPVAQLAQALIPEGRFIYNLLIEEPAPLLYGLTKLARVFGSDLDKFSPQKIVAIHDGCGLAMPHAYDQGRDNEGGEILRAIEMGADGVQTNQPALARALLVGAVATRWIVEDQGRRLCLVNAGNGYGLPQKAVTLETRAGRRTAETGVGGCVELADDAVRQAHFAGDDSAAPATATFGDGPVAGGQGGGGAIGAGWLLIGVLCAGRRLRFGIARRL